MANAKGMAMRITAFQYIKQPGFMKFGTVSVSACLTGPINRIRDPDKKHVGTLPRQKACRDFDPSGDSPTRDKIASQKGCYRTSQRQAGAEVDGYIKQK